MELLRVPHLMTFRKTGYAQSAVWEKMYLSKLNIKNRKAAVCDGSLLSDLTVY